MASSSNPPNGSDESGRRVRRVLLASGTLYFLIISVLSYIWYTPQWVSGFHFFNDLPEWQQLDKVSHFFITFQVCAFSARLLRWAKIPDAPITRYATAMGFLFVSGIEILDGFSELYGASVFDVMANALGAGFYFIQIMFWKKINIWPKISFHQTAFAPLRPQVLGDGLMEEMIKDYNGQTFWYSVHIPQLRLPQWLTLAFGVGGEGMVHGREHENNLLNLSPHRRYFISLDLRLSHIQSSSKILNSGMYILNFIKIPAPAIEFSTQGVRFHILYF